MRIFLTVSGVSFSALVLLLASCGTDAASVGTDGTRSEREGGADGSTSDAGPGEAGTAEAGIDLDAGDVDAAKAPCPNAPNTPGGPDGMGGCWPFEGNTGVPAGTTLSDYTGPCTITTPNTVIDKKTLNCDLVVRAAGVVITNSKINGRIANDDCSKYSFTVSDTRIHTADINFRGLSSCGFTATRVDVSGGQSMAWCGDGCTIKDSYLHNPLEDPEGAAANHAAHNSTVRVAGSGAKVLHNTLWCEVKEYPQPNGQDTSGCSANQTAYSHDGNPPSNALVEANLYMPTTGGFCAYGGSTSGELGSVHDMVFRNNVFVRGKRKSDHGEYVCGYYGTVTSFDASRPGNKWENNRFDDGTLVNP